MSNPIIIVGGGPVGLMLACELGAAGMDAVVLERQEKASVRSRGAAINAAVVELLSQRGIMDSLVGDGIEFRQAHFAHIPLDPPRLAERHAFSFAIPHAVLERRLEEWATKAGVVVRRGVEVVGLTCDDEGVDVTVRSYGIDSTVRGSYVVGCDGARSTVRELVGIDFPGISPPFYGLLGDVQVEAGSPLLDIVGPRQYEGGLCTVVPSGPDTLRIITGEFDNAPQDRNAPVSFDELREAVARITGLEPEGHPLWLVRWDADTRQAAEYRAGRVFLAGDAAHIHFPLGGQALSTGFEDAVNLGWKLAAVSRGSVAEELLDTYQMERHPVGARACRTSRAQTALMRQLTEVQPLRDVLAELVQFDGVNEYLVKMVGGLDVRYPIDDGHSDSEGDGHVLVGSRLGDIPLTTEDGDTSLAALLASAHGVLLDFSESAQLQHVRAEWSGRVVYVRAEATSEIDAAVVLLRPDGRVAWAADATGVASAGQLQGLRAALRRWFGEPETD